MSKARNNLLRYINYYGISKAKIAEISGLSESTLTKLLDDSSGGTQRLTQAARAMVVLGISPEDILGEAKVEALLNRLERGK